MKRRVTKTNRGGVNLGSAFLCILFLVSGTVLLFPIYQALRGYEEPVSVASGITYDNWEGFVEVNEGEKFHYRFSGSEFEFMVVDPLGEILKDEMGAGNISGKIVAVHFGLHHVSVRALNPPYEPVGFSLHTFIIKKYSILDILSPLPSLIGFIAGISCVVLGLLFLLSIRT